MFLSHYREKDKKKGKKTEADEGSGGDSPGSPGEDGAADAGKDEEEVVWMTDTSAQAAQERAQQQLTKAMADMVTQVYQYIRFGHVRA